MKRDTPHGGPAFPLQTTVSSGMGGTIDLTDRHRMQYGMTMRDYFAAKALQGIIAHGPDAKMMDMVPGARGGAHEAAAAYAWADAMLLERSK